MRAAAVALAGQAPRRRSPGSRRRRGPGGRRARRARCASARCRGRRPSRTRAPGRSAARTGGTAARRSARARCTSTRTRPSVHAAEEAPVGPRQALEVDRRPAARRARSSGTTTSPDCTERTAPVAGSIDRVVGVRSMIASPIWRRRAEQDARQARDDRTARRRPRRRRARRLRRRRSIGAGSLSGQRARARRRRSRAGASLSPAGGGLADDHLGAQAVDQRPGQARVDRASRGRPSRTTGAA